MDDPTKTSKGVIQVLFVAAEAEPFIKVGGLGDVSGALPPALRALDPEMTGGYLLDVRLVIPFHGAINTSTRDVWPLATFNVPKPGGAVQAQAFQTEVNGMPVYLIAGAPIQPDAPVYSMDTALDGEKYTFFSIAVLELARALNWQPDIIHANDWHSAVTLHLLEEYRQRDPFFKFTHSVLTIHNLPFMGGGVSPALYEYGIAPRDDPKLPVWGRHFPLLMGLSAADRIVAVSPTYARELLTPEFGFGVENFLKSRESAIVGILNGVDTASFNPANDSVLIQTFDPDHLPERARNKTALQSEFDLPQEARTPLLIMISRMDQQKGVDIAVDALRRITHLPWQTIILGSGDPELENACRLLEADYPKRVRAAIRFDVRLSRRMYAGADCLLMPSRYEPCGLAQMIAMRYGCIPIARAVGGLGDTIQDNREDAVHSSGYLFQEASPSALAAALERALKDYSDLPGWQARQNCGMRKDFSWPQSARKYAQIYRELGKEG